MSYLTNSNTSANPNYIPPPTKQYDRDTALAILKELAGDMRPDYDLFGTETLVIYRYRFEAIRAKYLDSEEHNNSIESLKDLLKKKDAELQEVKSRVGDLIARNARLDYDLGCAYQHISILKGE